MKNLICLTLVSMAFSSAIFAKKIEEQVYIQDLNLLKYIKTQPALTVDHISEEGFELYGPTGMKQWLVDVGADFIESSDFCLETKNFDLGYPSFEEIEIKLKQLVAKYPKLAKLISIGKSVEGRDLWVVKISDNVEKDETEPEFKYISSMHGNEITGRELTQFLIEDLLQNYGSNPLITDLINNTEIFIMPSMNPDGSKKRRRSNANRVDLNRDFPDWSRGDGNSFENREPETIALMKFQAKHNFSLSANFHGGAVVVNYPWDNTHERHPLDSLAQQISLDYADLNPEMRNSTRFTGGITNGADWYVLKGGMQDWSYYFYNDLQVTIELSNTKWPSYSDIPKFYQNNRDAMIGLVKSIHQGNGFTFKDRSLIGKVTIYSLDTNRKIGTFAFTKGEFYKVLEVGKYRWDIQTEAGANRTLDIEVNDSINTQSFEFL